MAIRNQGFFLPGQLIVMNQKIKSTYDEHVETLAPEQKKAFDRGLKDLALSELILALMEHDDISVRKLAKIAGISPNQ